jgi:hypothetical protein
MVGEPHSLGDALRRGLQVPIEQCARAQHRQPLPAIESQEMSVAGNNDLGAGLQGAGQELVILRVLTDSRCVISIENEKRLRDEQRQERLQVHAFVASGQPLTDAAILIEDRGRYGEVNAFVSPAFQNPSGDAPKNTPDTRTLVSRTSLTSSSGPAPPPLPRQTS